MAVSRVSAIRKLIKVSASRASRLQMFVDTHTHIYTHERRKSAIMNEGSTRPHSQWQLFVYRYTFTHTQAYTHVLQYIHICYLFNSLQKEMGTSNWFQCKKPDTKTKYNRLKNVADKVR